MSASSPATLPTPPSAPTWTGYGKEQTPRDLDTIADVQQIPNLLRQRGYSEEDVQAIMHGNWIRFFREAWPG
jgi:microsomal dipeptidase-like Zn-dependent dipeptidase